MEKVSLCGLSPIFYAGLQGLLREQFTQGEFLKWTEIHKFLLFGGYYKKFRVPSQLQHSGWEAHIDGFPHESSFHPTNSRFSKCPTMECTVQQPLSVRHGLVSMFTVFFLKIEVRKKWVITFCQKQFGYVKIVWEKNNFN